MHSAFVTIASHPEWVDERDLADEDWVEDRWGS